MIRRWLTCDPQDLVRRAIENRLLDSSPAVRDAAIELVGKYVGSRPELAVTYYPHISARITDKGLNVRKRVVKLLRQIYATLDESTESIRIDICRRLISRVYDEDDSIKVRALLAAELGARLMRLAGPRHGLHRRTLVLEGF